MTTEQAIKNLVESLVESFVTYYCSLCDGWNTVDPFEAAEHHKLMNKGKPKTSQWYHVIEARKT